MVELVKQNADRLSIAGLTGATAASRYVGATASGAPATGTFLVGDFVVDQTGAIHVCTVAGTPGGWTKIGGTPTAGGGLPTQFIRDISAGGHLNVASTSWSELAAVTNGPGTGGFDLTVPASAGDIIEFSPLAFCQDSGSTLRFDVATIVAAAVVNTFSGSSVSGSTTFGVGAWQAVGSRYDAISGPAWYTVQAGDIDASGNVTVRPYVRVDSSTRSVLRDANNALFFGVKNLGAAPL